MFLACTLSKVTMANHTLEIFNIENLLIRKDFMSSQSSIFFPEKFYSNVLKCGFSAKLDTITDILNFFKSNSIKYNIQNQSSINIINQSPDNKNSPAALWNISIISDERKVFSNNSFCTKA